MQRQLGLEAHHGKWLSYHNSLNCQVQHWKLNCFPTPGCPSVTFSLYIYTSVTPSPRVCPSVTPSLCGWFSGG